MKIFHKQEGKSTTDLYKEAKAFREEVIKRDPTVICEIISRKIAFPPKGIVPKTHWWCPYCCKPRIFMESNEYSTRNCIICGISDADWHVKKYNPTKYELEDHYSYCKINLLKEK